MNRIGIAAIIVMAIAVPVLAGEGVTYEKDIKGMIASRCIACHGPEAPAMEEFDRDKERYKKEKKGPRLDTYGSLMAVVKGSDAGALMRRLDDGRNTKDGKPGNMHGYLGSTEAERSANLAIFKEWVGGWTLKRKKDLGKEEFEAIKAREK